MTGAERAGSRVGRLPDFVIVGAMKSGTTSLFNWLGEHRDVVLPEEKEPGFFTATRTDRARLRYEAQFALAADALTGEASTAYTADDRTEAIARRMADILGNRVRLIYVLRDPAARLRSHYAHEVRRNREHEPLARAATAASRYVAASSYFDRLVPFLDHFPASDILLVDFEALTGADDDEWLRLLDFLVLDREPRPGTGYNRAEGADSFTRLGSLLWRTRLLRTAGRLPAPVRRSMRSLAISRSSDQDRLLGTTTDSLPTSVVSTLDAQTCELRAIAASTADGAHFRPAWLEP